MRAQELQEEMVRRFSVILYTKYYAKSSSLSKSRNIFNPPSSLLHGAW
jgi:hypothetical protein